MSNPLIEALDLWLEYPGARKVQALRGIDLAIEAGSYVGIMGPSGSGKSSLIYALAGLRRPTRGSVRFRGVPWPFPIGLGAGLRRSSVGFVFQEPFLVPEWTVAENVRVQQNGRDPGRIEALAAALCISNLLDERPERLSAGERQRAGVARALVNDPALILADEPTSCLDTEQGLNVMRVLTGARGRSALIVCSHDSRMLSGADRVVRIEDGTLRP